MERVVVGVVVVVEDVADVGDEAGLDVVEVVGFLPDEPCCSGEGHGPAVQHAVGATSAGLSVGAVKFVFGVHAVVVQDVGVTLHPGEVHDRGCVLVGGDGEAGSVGVVAVVPVQFGPGFGVVGVGGDEQEPVGVGAGWVAEGVEGGDEEEVERFDLLGPRPSVVPAGEGSS